MIDLRDISLLVIAPHADDEVIGCGGLITRVKAAGGRVFVLYMTSGTTVDFSRHGRSSAQERQTEIERVAAHFGIDGWRLVFGGDEHHLRLDCVPQRDIINEIERGAEISLEETRPDIIVYPQFDDYNQDHRAAAQAAAAACRPVPRSEKFVPDLILQSESPMNQWVLDTQLVKPNVVVALEKQQLEAKVTGMELYASQVRGSGHPRHSDNLRALARLRGSLIGEQFGEAFYCQGWRLQ